MAAYAFPEFRADAAAADPSRSVAVVAGDPDPSRAERIADEPITDERGADDGWPWWDAPGARGEMRPRRHPWRERWRYYTSALVPFGWGERVRHERGYWRARAFRLAGLATFLGLTLVASIVTLSLASRLVSGTPGNPLASSSSGSRAGGVVVQPVFGGGDPTPTPGQYLIGAWVSDSAPASGTVQAFVRVTLGDAQGNKPLAGASVQIAVAFTGGTAVYGPVATDRYGLATFAVAYAGRTGGLQPVFITATTTAGGQQLSAQTSFTPH